MADGYHGWPDGAPYDRVIGTCFAWPLRHAWIRQTTPRGRIVAVAPNGLVTLTVADDGSASGPFHPHDFGFMHMRGGHMPERIPRGAIAALLGSGERLSEDYGPAAVLLQSLAMADAQPPWLGTPRHLDEAAQRIIRDLQR